MTVNSQCDTVSLSVFTDSKHGRREMMTNTEMLNKAFTESGVTITFLANKLGCTRNRIYAILGGSEIKLSEITAICDALHISKKDRDAIFFAN